MTLEYVSPAEQQAIAAEPYEHRGMLHSEMALIIDTARRLGIKVFLESGRARAQSTYMLAKYLPDVEIHSIDGRPSHPDTIFGMERVKGFSNVHLYNGEGAKALLDWCIITSGKPTAVLCDGPKGLDAVSVVRLCLRQHHVLAGFIHDMRPVDHGKPSPYRMAAQFMLPNPFFSDHPEYVAATSWMDAKAVEANGPVGPEYEKMFGSYGPTVGVFVNRRTSPSKIS